MGLRLRTLVVCVLLVAGVALTAVAPTAAAISGSDDGDWENDENDWGDNDSDWHRNDSESVRNLTETATGTVENATGAVLDATNRTNGTNGTAVSAGGGADGTDRSVDSLGVFGGEPPRQSSLDAGVADIGAETAPSVFVGAPAIDVTTSGVGIEVGSTTNSAPGLALDVPLSGSSTSSETSVTPPETDGVAVPEVTSPSVSASTDGDSGGEAAGANAIAVEPTTGGETAADESGESTDTATDEAKSASLLGSLAWFDGTELLDYTPALGTAMFVAVAQPWTGFLSMSSALLVDWLGRFATMFRFGRHDGSDPLEHETRKRIHDRINDAPGVSLSALAEDLDTPLSTVRHHLRVLERERLVTSRKLRGNRRHFPVGTENEELAAALEKDSSAAIIGALRKYGAATVGDIVDEVETSYSTVSYHLSRLADDGLVVQEKDGASKVTRLAPSVRSTLETADDGPATGGSHEVSAD